MRKTLQRLWRAISGALGYASTYVFFGGIAALNSLDLLLSWAERGKMSDLWGFPIWLWSLGAIVAWVVGALLVRLVRLEAKQEPSLEISYEEKSPFVITEPFNSTENASRRVRVKVTNTGGTDITNAILMLDDIQQDGRTCNAFVPAGMITQHQALQNRTGGVFNLRIGESKLVEIAELDERVSDSEILLRYETKDYPNGMPRSEYVLVLTAYGGGRPASQTFTLYVDGGRLRMEKAK